MHLTYAIIVLDYANQKRVSHFIVNIIHVIFKGGPLLLSHALLQIELNILLELIAVLCSTERVTINPKGFHILL